MGKTTVVVNLALGLQALGQRVMSIGWIVSEAEVINPSAKVAGQAVVQTLWDVPWGELDIPVIDLPPSAGQLQQDLVARVQMDGVVIVTIRQDLSLLGTSRALQMSAQAGLPIVSLVENMSYFVDPNCGEWHEIFQHSDNWRPVALTRVPVLGHIPLTPEISRSITREHPWMAGARRESTGRDLYGDRARCRAG